MRIVGCIGLIIGIGFYYSVYKRYHDIIHPIGMMILSWFVSGFIASWKLAPFQHSWTLLTSFLILATGVLLFFWSITSLPEIHYSFEKNNNTINNSYQLLTRLLFLFCLFTCLYSIRIFKIQGQTLAGSDAKGIFSTAIKDAPKYILYGNLLLPYTSLCSVFEILYGKRTRCDLLFNAFVLVFSAFYIWFISKSRGTLSIVIFGALFIIVKRLNWSFFKVARILIVLVLAFSFLMLFRVKQGSSIYSGVFSNPAINATYNYIASSFENLNSIISDEPRYYPFANTLIMAYKTFGIYNETTMSCSLNYTVLGIYNASPFIAYYYFDFGILGLILGVSVIGVFLSILYRKSLSNIYYILILSMFQKGVFTPCLGDNIINGGSLSAWIGYIIVIIICLISQTTERVSIKYYEPG